MSVRALNCPDVSNPDQIDLDRDGIGDLCDSSTRVEALTVVSRLERVYGIATGDLDENGTTDLVVSGYEPHNQTLRWLVQIMLGDGNGGFQEGPIGVGAELRDIETGDMDGTNGPDVVAANFDGPTNQGYGVFLNDGSGTLSPVQTTATGYFPYDVELGQMDAGTELDVVISTYDGSKVFLSDGAGGISTSCVFSPLGFEYIELVDLDLDGNLDIIGVGGFLSGFYTPSAAVYYGDGNGSVSSEYLYGLFAAKDVAAGDFDGDGHIDLVAPNRSGMTMIKGLGGRVFGPVAWIDGELGAGRGDPLGIEAGDWDGNGSLDLAVVRWNDLLPNGRPAPEVQFFWNDGSANFDDSDFAGVGIWVQSDMATGDFDGDGTIDLAVANPRGATIFLPEPSGLAMLVTGAFALLCMKHARRRRHG